MLRKTLTANKITASKLIGKNSEFSKTRWMDFFYKQNYTVRKFLADFAVCNAIAKLYMT